MSLIGVENLTFSYDGARVVLDGLSFSVGEGEAFCVVGANGCGKTTLIDCLLGLNKTATGNIIVGGQPIGTLKPRELAERVAYVPQGHKTTFAYKVLDVVTMGRTYAARTFAPPNEQERALAREALARVGLSGFEDREYTRLSGGELQLVLVARAIAQQARVLVMDEPTAHLDFRHEMGVMEIIADLVKTSGISIVMATHFLNQAFYLENAGANVRVALMENSRFAHIGPPSEVLTSENLAKTFHIVTEIVEGGAGARKYILPLYMERTE